MIICNIEIDYREIVEILKGNIFEINKAYGSLKKIIDKIDVK